MKNYLFFKLLMRRLVKSFSLLSRGKLMNILIKTQLDFKCKSEKLLPKIFY